MTIDGGGEGVILFHGIMRTSRSMRRLADHLERQGYAVLNLDYPSTAHALDRLAELVTPQVAEFAARVSRVHLVGFSMGGLLIRTIMKVARPENLGRVVMIGTPNNGSDVADLLQTNPLYISIYGPAGQQLVTDQSTFSDLFEDDGYELGVIAGWSVFNPVARLVFGTPSDGKVSIESTSLPICRDHMIVRRNHTFLILTRRVFAETAGFLRCGRFSESAERIYEFRR